MVSSSSNQRSVFWQSLTAIAYKEGTPQELSSKLQQAILIFGSETPDNLDCVDQICIGEAQGTIGPILKGTGELLSDIAWSLEDMPMPSILADMHPDISKEHWGGFTRFVTLMLSALNRDIEPPN